LRLIVEQKMPIKGNQFKGNTFKSNTISEKPNKPTKPSRSSAEYLPKFDLQDGRIVKIFGLIFIVFSVFFLVAFTSYIFTWEEDQSYVIDANGGWSNLFKSMEELRQSGVHTAVVQNWLGKFGALLSHQFIFEWFGVASFLFVFVFFVIGYRMLFRVKVFSLEKVFAYSFFFLLFTSTALGFGHSFFAQTPHFLEGQFGFWSNRLLEVQVGQIGVAGILIFLGLSVLIIAYNIDFKLPEPKLAPNPRRIVPQEDEGLEENGGYGNNFTAASPEHRNTNPEHEDSGERLQQNLPRVVDFSADKPDPPKSGMELETETFSNVMLSPSPASAATIAASTVPAMEVSQPKDEELLSPPLSVENPKTPTTAEDLVEKFGQYDPTLDLENYQRPTLDLLEDYGSHKIAVDSQELEANKDKIVETLSNYNIDIDKIKATIGPTVTLYEIIPAPGVRISKIKNLEDDIALSLAALGIRIIAPMPGKGTIGIEVPNSHPEMVAIRSVLATDKFRNNSMDLPIALGKTISNEVFIADLAKMPHLLVAGATGQGKSVGINAILVSLLFSKHPSQLKFVLVDPKKVELTLFNKIERHFLAKLPGGDDAIITDTKKVIHTLNSLCIEMDQRYDLLKDAQVRNLKEYNTKFVNRKLNPENGHRFLPYIVLVVDEFADLIMTAGKEVETPIARLAQLARAIGIHLVLATQRPSVNVITGTIKANFPARLAFRVLSKIDSRTILDSGGADQLIGRGDMLLATGSDLIRLQCAFVDTPEVDRVSEFIGQQRAYPDAYLLPEYVDENGEGSSKEFDPSDRDPLFEEAAQLIVSHQQGSTSLIQRKMKLGYNRAGRIIDQLEAAGVVGPFEGSKAREVLISDMYALEQFLSNLDSK
jgi:S-DNA-T family DNA segregation ATPase FtsK/SpoIIIE